jgi:23S rRNA pseudouridine1911/1915/1917 synthase
VHRLDRDTSGLLVVAKSDEVHRALKDALQRREITREYLALVEGRPEARSGTVDAPIGRDRRVRTRMSIDTDEPREARTHFEIERALPRTTLLRVRLETGRTHQIRIHLAGLGHPLAGDTQHGGEAARTFLPRAPRLAPHAAILGFTHPATKERVRFESPPPDDLAAYVERLRSRPAPYGYAATGNLMNGWCW